MPTPLPPAVNVTTLITDALRDGGVLGNDEDAEPAMLNRAFRAMNNMLAEANTQRSMIFYLQTLGVVSTGAESYTIGNGQQFDTGQMRPDRLDFAVLRQINGTGSPGSQPFDWPLEILNAKQDYEAIRLKALGTFSRSIFLETSYPVGYVKPWPVPQASIYEVRITFKQLLTLVPDLNYELQMPPVYQSYFQYKLAQLFRSNYQLPPDPALDRQVRQSKNALTLGNVQVPQIRMPGDVLSGSGFGYNYRSDSQ